MTAASDTVAIPDTKIYLWPADRARQDSDHIQLVQNAQTALPLGRWRTSPLANKSSCWTRDNTREQLTMAITLTLWPAHINLIALIDSSDNLNIAITMTTALGTITVIGKNGKAGYNLSLPKQQPGALTLQYKTHEWEWTSAQP